MKNLKFVSAILMAITLVLSVGCASTAKQESTGEYVEDSVITARVKSAILGEKTLESVDINVETFKGSVQLSGFVNSNKDMSTAVEVAGKVLGVKSVKNDMRHK